MTHGFLWGHRFSVNGRDSMRGLRLALYMGLLSFCVPHVQAGNAMGDAVDGKGLIHRIALTASGVAMSPAAGVVPVEAQDSWTVHSNGYAAACSQGDPVALVAMVIPAAGTKAPLTTQAGRYHGLVTFVATCEAGAQKQVKVPYDFTVGRVVSIAPKENYAKVGTRTSFDASRLSITTEPNVTAVIDAVRSIAALPDMATPGTQTVTVTYGNSSAPYSVEVSPTWIKVSDGAPSPNPSVFGQTPICWTDLWFRRRKREYAFSWSDNPVPVFQGVMAAGASVRVTNSIVSAFPGEVGFTFKKVTAGYQYARESGPGACTYVCPADEEYLYRLTVLQSKITLTATYKEYYQSQGNWVYDGSGHAFNQTDSTACYGFVLEKHTRK